MQEKKEKFSQTRLPTPSPTGSFDEKNPGPKILFSLHLISLFSTDAFLGSLLTLFLFCYFCYSVILFFHNLFYLA